MTDSASARDAYAGRSPFASASKPPVLQRFVSLTASLKGYSGGRLKVDATAGQTVAALALPAGMAYADLAGLPVTAGPHSLLLPVLVYDGLGATKRDVIGPERAVALLVAAACGSWSPGCERSSSSRSTPSDWTTSSRPRACSPP
jgi:SulP family sulfate permease